MAMIIVLLLTFSGRAVADDVTWTVVSTSSELYSALKGGEKHIKITADINVKDASTKNDSFDDVEICGIKDSYVKGQEYPYYRLFNNDGNLFKNLTNSKLHHLIIEGATHELCETGKKCTFNEMIFNSCKPKDDTNLSCLVTKYSYDNGFSEVLFMNCALYLDEGWTDREEGDNPDTFARGRVGFLGTIMKGGTVENCVVAPTCAVYSTEGIVGSFTGVARNVSFNKCLSLATVMGYNDKCGGFAGYIGDCTVTDCTFCGIVKHVKYSDEDTFVGHLAKFVGMKDYVVNTANRLNNIYNLYEELKILMPSTWTGYNDFFNVCFGTITDIDKSMDALSHGIMNRLIKRTVGLFTKDAATVISVASKIEFFWNIYCLYSTVQTAWEWGINSSAPDEVGGMGGYCKNSTISHCANFGQIYSLDAYAGGLVGYGADVNLVNCLNQGAVHGGEQTGGLAGCMSGGSIRTCANMGSVSCSDTEYAGHICGKSKDYCKWQYNCYSDTLSEIDDTPSTFAVKVSQKDIVSGKVAWFLNKWSKTVNNTTDDCWFQKVGTDHWPNLTAENGVVSLTGDNGINTHLSTTINVADNTTLVCALANPYSDINILCDIDFENSPVYNYCSAFMPFCGKIEGNGHKISNINFTQTGKTFTFMGFESLWTSIQNVGILGCARNATFRNFSLENIVLDMSTNVSKVSLFVGLSQNSTYENVHLTGTSKIMESDGKEHYEEIIGGLVGESVNDKFSNCSTGPLCRLYSSGESIGNGFEDYSLMGGIAGWAQGSSFFQCVNRASVTIGSKNKFVGGIVGDLTGGSIDRCLNTGEIRAYECMGGIAGCAGGTATVTRCVNTGCMEKGYRSFFFSGFYCNTTTFCGGIVGKLHGSKASMSGNMNFGSVNNPGDDCSPIGTSQRNATIKDDNYYYCQYAGKHKDNESCFKDTNYRYDKMLSGEFACNVVYDSGEKYFYQSIDNNVFKFSLPVPLPSAGTVYRNVQCDGTAGYSNIYKSTASHTPDPDGSGVCSICGKLQEADGGNVTIGSAYALNALARSVNDGTDYTGKIIILKDDIDMSEVTGYIPIGNESHPFKGSFDGQGHTISNLNIYATNDGVGLFGTVAGDNTVIRNVTVDSSCSVAGTSNCVAGVVGCVKSTSGSTCQVTIQNCGNEASVVAGKLNASGILGGVYNNDKTQIYIRNCYNTGNISGSQSATICGYARKNYNIQNCYNIGSLNGGTSGSLFYRHESSGTHYVENCYDVNGTEGAGVTSITYAQISDSTLCGKLNDKTTGTDFCWKQSGGYPQFDILQTDNMDYLCFTAAESTKVAFVIAGSSSILPSLEYSANNRQWADYDFGTEVQLAIGESVMFRAKTTNSVFSENTGKYIHFTSTGKVAASGNIMSLLDKECKTTAVPEAAFNHLFWDCANLTSAPNLPATTLAARCYECMFQSCTSLTVAPDLPATSVAEECYYGMFKGCKAMTTVPQLPATTMATRCYNSMFYGCTSITEAPELPAVTMATDCYYAMFYNCTSLGKIKVYFKDWGNNNYAYTNVWLYGVPASGTLICYTSLGKVADKTKPACNIPTGWTVQYLDNAITLNSKGYATYSGSVDVAIKTDGVKAYKVAVYEGHLVLTQLDGYIPAGTGVLLYGTANTCVEFKCPEATTSAADVDDNELKPTTTQDIDLVDRIDAWGLGSDIVFAKYDNDEFAPNSAFIAYEGNSFADTDVLTPDYLCFSNDGSSSSDIKICCSQKFLEDSYSSYIPKLEYSRDKVNWTTCGLNTTNGTTVSVDAGGKVYYRAQSANTTFSKDYERYAYFTMGSGEFSASGNMASMLDKNCIRTDIPEWAFVGLFENCTALTTAPELPFTDISKGCYGNMFHGCTSLKRAPALPAVKLPDECYSNMFNGCTSLTSIPDLSHVTPTAELACYGMFQGCTSLRVNTIGPGTEWRITDAGKQGHYDFLSMFLETGGNFTGTPEKDVTYYVLDQPYTREMDNQWGTICLPFAVDVNADADYDFYRITKAESGTLTLEKIAGTLGAGIPALIRRNANVTEVSIPASTTNTDFVTSPVAGGNNLTGTFTDTELPSGYIIANNSFWDVSYLKSNVSGTTSVKCSAFHAYIAGTISSAKELTLVIGDDFTAVNSVNNEQLTVNNGKYIENGRVVILKNNRKYNLNGQEIK